MNNTTVPTGTTSSISGTLLDGEALNNTFIDYSILELNVGTPPVLPTPEPSAFLGLCLGLLGLGGLTVKARRRNASAAQSLARNTWNMPGLTQ